MNQNPYAAPSAIVTDAPARQDARLEYVAKGQRMMVWAVLASILLSLSRMGITSIALSLLAFALMLLSMLFGIIGAVRVAKGLGSGVAVRVLVAILMLVPLVSLITMLVLSMRATRALRAGGWSVGLMGARAR